MCHFYGGREELAVALDVMQRHSCALERPDEGWQILT